MKSTIEIITEIERLLLDLKSSLGEKFPNEKQSLTEISTNSVFFGLTKDIYNLVEEGFFSESRSISEIQKKLRNEGVMKPTTSLMKPLLLLIKKKVLARSKPTDGTGTFRYQKK